MISKRIISATLIAAVSIITVPIGSLMQAPAQAACCYFAAKDKDINQPGQKAFISWNPQDKIEAFTVQPKFEGNAVDFGMVIPTPSQPKLDEMPRDFFKDLAIYTILMPLPKPIYLQPMVPRAAMMRSAVMEGAALGARPRKKRKSVRILESGVVGSLDYKIIVADDASGLFDWLKENKYSYAGDEATLRFYIKKKWFFTVMKIDPKQMKKAADGSYLGEVTPTRFTFKSGKCVYPLKITQLSVKDKTDALFYVQAPEQMDLVGDWSFMHSYRCMFLNFMLGCGANPQQRQELMTRQKWVSAKKRRDPRFLTTKLEWAKKLGNAEISVLENPVKNYAQMGSGDLPPGARAIALPQFLKQIKAEFLAKNKQMPDYIRQKLIRMEDRYQPGKGMIVQYDQSKVGRARFIRSKYYWYPNREAPLKDVKGLSRLKGHLKKGQWLTKFRKVLRKDEMTSDMVLSAVPESNRQTYIRIMPTSPP